MLSLLLFLDIHVFHLHQLYPGRVCTFGVLLWVVSSVGVTTHEIQDKLCNEDGPIVRFYVCCHAAPQNRCFWSILVRVSLAGWEKYVIVRLLDRVAGILRQQLDQSVVEVVTLPDRRRDKIFPHDKPWLVLLQRWEIFDQLVCRDEELHKAFV